MHDYSQKSLSEIYPKSVVLSEAALRFARPELRSRYLELRGRPLELPEVDPNAARTFDAAIAALNAFAAHHRPLNDLMATMEHELLQWLSTRKLIGIGYSLPRHPNDLVHLIPIDLWTKANTRFAKDQANGNGLQFAAVRIALPAWIKPAIDKALEVDTQPAPLAKALTIPNRPKGRPSQKPLIMAAIAGAHGQGLLDLSKPTIAANRLLSEMLKRQPELQNQAGLSTESIRRCIHQYRDEIQRTQKPPSKT